MYLGPVCSVGTEASVLLGTVPLPEDRSLSMDSREYTVLALLVPEYLGSESCIELFGDSNSSTEDGSSSFDSGNKPCSAAVASVTEIVSETFVHPHRREPSVVVAEDSTPDWSLALTEQARNGTSEAFEPSWPEKS